MEQFIKCNCNVTANFYTFHTAWRTTGTQGIYWCLDLVTLICRIWKTTILNFGTFAICIRSRIHAQDLTSVPTGIFRFTSGWSVVALSDLAYYLNYCHLHRFFVKYNLLTVNIGNVLDLKSHCHFSYSNGFHELPLKISCNWGSLLSCWHLIETFEPILFVIAQVH